VEVWLDALESCYSSEECKVGEEGGEAPRAGVASEELSCMTEPGWIHELGWEGGTWMETQPQW
jgi:hypothetical protein